MHSFLLYAEVKLPGYLRSLVQAFGMNVNTQKMLTKKSKTQDKGARNTCLSDRPRQSNRAKVRTEESQEGEWVSESQEL